MLDSFMTKAEYNNIQKDMLNNAFNATKHNTVRIAPCKVCGDQCITYFKQGICSICTRTYKG